MAARGLWRQGEKLRAETNSIHHAKLNLIVDERKDQVTSKRLWFPNTPGICLNSPRILEMLSVAVLLTTGLRTSIPSNQGSGQHYPLANMSDKDGHLYRSGHRTTSPCVYEKNTFVS